MIAHPPKMLFYHFFTIEAAKMGKKAIAVCGMMSGRPCRANHELEAPFVKLRGVDGKVPKKK